MERVLEILDAEIDALEGWEGIARTEGRRNDAENYSHALWRVRLLKVAIGKALSAEPAPIQTPWPPKEGQRVRVKEDAKQYFGDSTFGYNQRMMPAFDGREGVVSGLRKTDGIEVEFPDKEWWTYPLAALEPIPAPIQTPTAAQIELRRAFDAWEETPESIPSPELLDAIHAAAAPRVEPIPAPQAEKPKYKVGDWVDVKPDAKACTVYGERQPWGSRANGKRTTVLCVESRVLKVEPGAWVHIDDVTPASPASTPPVEAPQKAGIWCLCGDGIELTGYIDSDTRLVCPGCQREGVVNFTRTGPEAAYIKMVSEEEARREYIRQHAPTLLAQIIIANGGYSHQGGDTEGAIELAARLYDAPIPPITEKEKA